MTSIDAIAASISLPENLSFLEENEFLIGELLTTEAALQGRTAHLAEWQRTGREAISMAEDETIDAPRRQAAAMLAVAVSGRVWALARDAAQRRLAA